MTNIWIWYMFALNAFWEELKIHYKLCCSGYSEHMFSCVQNTLDFLMKVLILILHSMHVQLNMSSSPVSFVK